MENIDDLKDKITHSKERIRFGFSLIRSIEKRIETKKAEIEELKLTAEADLIEARSNAKQSVLLGMIYGPVFFIFLMFIKPITAFITSFISEYIINLTTEERAFIEEQNKIRSNATNSMFDEGNLETIQNINLTFDAVHIFLLISFIVIIIYMIIKSYLHYRSLNKRGVSEHIEIRNSKKLNIINCYSGYINKVRKEIKQDRIKMRETKYKLRLLERK